MKNEEYIIKNAGAPIFNDDSSNIGEDTDEFLDNLFYGGYFENAEELGENAMLYGHSDIKVYATFDSKYKDNVDVLKSTTWFSSYEVALHISKKNNTGCVAEAIVNTEGILDLLNSPGINYINNYYKWLKDNKVIKENNTLADVVSHLASQSDSKIKIIRNLKEDSRSSSNRDKILDNRLEVFKIIDTSIIKNIKYKEID